MEMYNDPPAAIFQAKAAKNLTEQEEQLDPAKIKEILLEHWNQRKGEKFQGNPRVVDDIEKRVKNLTQKLDDGQLSEKTLKVLGHFAFALAQKDLEKATKVQVDLITQYYDEVGFAMVGIKRMLADTP